MGHPTTDPSTPPAFDVFDPEFIRCPFDGYHELRDRAPAIHVPEGKGFWLVTDHELVREVVADVERFSSESGPLGSTFPSAAAMARMAEITPPEGVPGRVATLLTLDPPGHTRNRKLVSRAFTPASVRRYEELTRSICRELIDEWVDGEETDFVSTFAVPLPVRVIARALDVPDDRVDDFKRWSDASVAPIGADLSDDDWVDVQGEVLELAAYIQTQIDRKRAAGPAEDIMSKLVHARLDEAEVAELGGETRLGLSDDEIQSIVRQLLVAGNETTTNLLTQSMVLLSNESQWWERMHEDPAAVPMVVEEALRYISPSAVNQRATTCDVDFHGVTIPAGDIVLVCYLAADHDPAVFPRPETFDPGRANLGDLLAFGRGIHFCPGAALARMEARVAFEELAAAIASFTIPLQEDLPWNSSFQLRAIRALPLVPTLRS
jgi:cytochrome P450